MKALILFHLRVGVRIALRSFAPIFSAIVAWIILQMYPAALVANLARAVYAVHPPFLDVALVVALAFALPAWACPRLSHGLTGWLRHLSISGIGNRRGLTLALVAVQLPLAVGLAILAIVAHAQDLRLLPGVPRWVLVLLAGAVAATPAQRRLFSMSLALAAEVLALGGWTRMLASVALLVVADAVAGGIRQKRPHKTWRTAGSLLDFRIAWRALGWRVLTGYAAGLIVLMATALFISNNELAGELAAGAARFGGGLACVLCISSLALKLAVRRPVWPLARSFPRSSSQKIATDSLFLGIHAVPLLGILATIDSRVVLSVLALFPLLCLRAAASMRRLPERRSGAAAYIVEGSFSVAMAALLPWTVFVWLAAAVPAFLSAREAEQSQKVTRWIDLHHASAGDTLSWGAQ